MGGAETFRRAGGRPPNFADLGGWSWNRPILFVVSPVTAPLPVGPDRYISLDRRALRTSKGAKEATPIHVPSYVDKQLAKDNTKFVF